MQQCNVAKLQERCRVDIFTDAFHVGQLVYPSQRGDERTSRWQWWSGIHLSLEFLAYQLPFQLRSGFWRLIIQS